MRAICGYLKDAIEHQKWKLFVVIWRMILSIGYESYLWLFEGCYRASEIKAICGYLKDDIEHQKWKQFVVIGMKILSIGDESYLWLLEERYWALEIKAICGYWKKDIEHQRWMLFVTALHWCMLYRDRHQDKTWSILPSSGQPASAQQHWIISSVYL